MIHCEKHVELAREAAQKSIAMLRNKDNTLPIAKDIRKVYVTGPLATDIQVLLSNYYGLSEDLVTILEGVMGKVSDFTSVQYRQGCLLDRPNANPIDWFTGVARESEVTFEITPEMMAMINMEGKSKLEKGEFKVTIGGSSPGQRGLDLGAAKPAVTMLTVR